MQAWAARWYGARAAGLVALLALAPSVSQAAERCTVADPTGTPLNLRSAPNGTILDRLDNGLPSPCRSAAA